MIKVINISSLKEMKEFAKDFAKSLKGNELIGLKGELGAGKTTFTKYVGEYLKVKEPIISPTFNIVKIYQSSLGALYHIDAYRLENMGYDPVLDDYLYDEKALRFVEWYDFIKDPIFDKAIIINIEVDKKTEKRKITIEER